MQSPDIMILLLFGQGLDHFFAGAADGAAPVFGQVFKTDPLGNLSFSVSAVRIVYVTAAGRLALVHVFRFGHHMLLVKIVD